jgi:hypothetical protein
VAKQKRGKGQPRKLAKVNVRAKLLKLIATTRSLKTACAAVGVSYVTMLVECDRDPEFAEAVEQAKAAKVGMLEDLVFKVAETDPPTLRWLLANIDRENYAQRPEPQQHAHAHVHVTSDPDEIQSKLAALAVEIGIENVVDAVRVEQANGHHKANGKGHDPTKT